MENNPLIFGKNELTRIVNLEPRDDELVIFQELENGEVIESTHKNRFWILSSKQPGNSWVKMTGELHYKWGKQFSDRKEFQKSMGYLKKSGYDIYTIYDTKESIMVKDGYTYFKGMKPNEVSILSFDIESTGLYHNDDSRVLLISNTFRKNGSLTRKLFAYDEYKDQGDMLLDWCRWVKKMNPSLMVGHNIYAFDLPYMEFVAKKNGLSGLSLGRDDSDMWVNNRPSKFRIDGSRDQEYNKIRIYGREVIDTMFLAIKFDVAAKKYESFGLKSIIKTEGLEKTNRQHYDSSQIRFKYKDPVEWKKIKEYCEHDADDSLALYDLMSPVFFYMANSIPKSFQGIIESATGGQINSMMVRSYLQEMHSLPKSDESMHFEGAISFGNPGIFRNVFKVDVSSLYPSIILQCDVYDEDKDPKGNFLKLVQTFTTERLKNKKLAKTSKYHDDLQSSQKIFINSCYGFLGTPGLNFNSPTAAEFITKTGRDILQTAINWTAAKGLSVCNADTDSVAINYADGRDISEEERNLLLSDLNSQYPEKIKFEDDGYFKTVCVLKAKNYILDDGKKVKIKGSALKASTKEKALQEFIKKTIDIILKNEDNYSQLYLQYVKEINSITDITRWATRKTISDKTLNNDRTNEVRIRNTLEGTEYVEGDRIYVYYKDAETLELAERFDGQYDKDRLYGKLFDTSKVFSTVLNTKELFKNYKLKRNKPELEEITK